MNNIKFFEFEEAYHEDKANHEYPTVSYTQDTDKVWYMVKTPSLFEFVDLGLPSGTLWATCNLGATKPEEVGLYFAWGETQGYSAEDIGNNKKQFYWGDYKWSSDHNDEFGGTMTKYNETDGLVTLESADDAATVVDRGCRMPTKEEFEELAANATSGRVENYNESGVNGILFTSNNNGNSIFLPSGGGSINGYIHDKNALWGYWSSSINLDDMSVGFESISHYAWMFSYYGDPCASYQRHIGVNIRPVKK